jgi:sugar phosphate isomerase/epimerase
MKKAMCHYSFHRRWKDERWDTDRLCAETKALGVEGIDFHAGLMGETAGAADWIRASVRRSGLTLSGLSLSTNFNLDDPAQMKEMIDRTLAWMRVASDLRAPVSRIFGGSLSPEKRADPLARQAAMPRIAEALGRVTREAERLGLVLALENHGLPCTAEEQVETIRQMGSPNLRATVDVGNYLSGGQEAVDAVRVAAPVCAYVHFKDFRKRPDPSKPWGWKTEPCTVGRGDVDHLGCLKALKAAGYDGYIALEYEGPDDEKVGVPESVHFMDEVMKGF